MINLLRNLLLVLFARFIRIVNQKKHRQLMLPTTTFKDDLLSTHTKQGLIAGHPLNDKEHMGEDFDQDIIRLKCADCDSEDELMYVEVVGVPVCMCKSCKIERLGEDPPTPKKKRTK